MSSAQLTPQRAVRDGLVIAGAMTTFALVFVWGPSLVWWSDALAWWTLDLDHLYERGGADLLAVGAFHFSPAMAWALAPLAALPWAVFVAAFLAINLGALSVMGRRRTLLLLIAFPPVAMELINGNIHLLMAAAIYLGMRYPVCWAFVLLSKVTPGVGLVWFAARREWRALAEALGATAVIVVLGMLIAPDLWMEWVRSLAIKAGLSVPTAFPPLVVRLPLAALLAWYAGRTGRAWLVPVACFLGMPNIWPHSTAILVASFPLWWERDRWRPVGESIVTAVEPANAAHSGDSSGPRAAAVSE